MFHILWPGIALLMMYLVELGTAIWFEHENHHILSMYFSHCSLCHKELVAHGTVPREWIDSSASIHSIIGDGKGKTYVFGKKRLVHKNIKHKEWTVIVKCFVKDTVLSLKRSPFVLYFSMFYELMICLPKAIFYPFRRQYSLLCVVAVALS